MIKKDTGREYRIVTLSMGWDEIEIQKVAVMAEWPHRRETVSGDYILENFNLDSYELKALGVEEYEKR